VQLWQNAGCYKCFESMRQPMLNTSDSGLLYNMQFEYWQVNIYKSVCLDVKADILHLQRYRTC
jgi:hypothetical protein